MAKLEIIIFVIGIIAISGLLYVLNLNTPEDFPDDILDSSKKYISRDASKCETLQFVCEDKLKPFYDSAGCGCEAGKEGDFVGCPEDAKLCPDGTVVARNPGLNCEFDKCPGDQSSAEEIYCKAIDREGDFCIEIYQPVCGWFDPNKIVCVKYPCAATYSNSCFACLDENVLYWTIGECPK